MITVYPIAEHSQNCNCTCLPSSSSTYGYNFYLVSRWQKSLSQSLTGQVSC